MKTAPDGQLDAFLDAHLDELIALRHDLHAHPELSHVEHRTTDLIRERLRLAGLEPRVLSTGTGLICDIGPTDGKVIAVRGDIDALGMEDTKDVPYRSTVPGVAHGCGHDLHTVVALGAGLALAARIGSALAPGSPRVAAANDGSRWDGSAAERAASEWSSDSTSGAPPVDSDDGLEWTPAVGVRLLFEPAEESVPGGAVTVIEEGGLDRVEAIFGFHADPKLDVGQVGVRTGALTAAADVVQITLTGPGGHTARPHMTVDLVAIAGRIAHELPGLVRQRTLDRLDGNAAVAVVFGALQAGDAANVIPTRAVLRGSVRTPDRHVWAEAESIVRNALSELLDGTGAGVEVLYRRGVPPVVNHAAASAILADAAREVVGDEGLVEPPRSYGGDSFAWYQERVPGCYARLGVHDPTHGDPRLDLHSGRFDVDDRAIGIGVRVMVRAVERAAARLAHDSRT